MKQKFDISTKFSLKTRTVDSKLIVKRLYTTFGDNSPKIGSACMRWDHATACDCDFEQVMAELKITITRA